MRILIIVLFLISSLAARETTLPTTPPSLEVTFIDDEIKIDGELSDPGWRQAARVRDFTQFLPEDNIKPSVETEVMIAYDRSNLYLAFVCQDDPGQIRATMTDRDGMFADDFIGIILDTYGNADWAYEFYVNPLGVQGDLRWVANGHEDSRFDLVYETEGKITPSGWQAEMAIPFSSLRFPSGSEQNWRATFWRSHPRDQVHKYSWAPLKIGEPCFFCQFGYLKGIRDVKSGSKLDLLPSVVGFQSGELEDAGNKESDFSNTDIDGEAALNVRYQLGAGLTAEGALNPDFSQVESDAARIDVNTTYALFYPERRPFFQEGSDLYNTFIDAIYTRSINDPDRAFKLTGRKDRTSFFYLLAHDENTPHLLPLEEQTSFAPLKKSTSNVARVRRTVLEDSYIGALVTDQRIDGGASNSVYGVDASLRFLRNYRIQGQYLGSRTEELNDPELSAGYLPDTTFDDGAHTVAFDGERFDGHALYVAFERQARLWNFDVDYYESTPTFRANNGFVTRNGSRMAEVWSGLFFRPNGRLITRVTPWVSIGRAWDFNGQRKDEWIRPTLGFNLAKQTFFQVQFLLSRERLRTVWFDDIRIFTFFAQNNAFDAFRLGFRLNYGNSIARNVDPLPVMGRETQVAVWGAIKPMQRLTIRPNYNYLKLLDRDSGEKIYEGFVLRSSLNYQFTRQLFLRMIVQYNDFGEDLRFEPLVTYKINPFTIFYVGSTHGFNWEIDKARNAYETSRQFFMKLQYLFRT